MAKYWLKIKRIKFTNSIHGNDKFSSNLKIKSRHIKFDYNSLYFRMKFITYLDIT